MSGRSAEEHLRELLAHHLDQAREFVNTTGQQPLLTTVGRLGRTDRAHAFALMKIDRALRLLAALAPIEQSQLLTDLDAVTAALLFGQLAPDDRARLIDRIPTARRQNLVAALEPHERQILEQLVSYPESSTGRAMSPAVISVHHRDSVAAALAHVREHGVDAETVYMVPVVDDGTRVLGVVSLRRLLFTEPDRPVVQVMSAPPVTVCVDEPAEDSARALRSAQLIAAPVVDPGDCLVGVLTVDDAMRILDEAEDEDLARGSGRSPLRRSYRSSSVMTLVRSRLGWLLVLIVAATLTVNVLDYFEETLAQAVTLALFVPLLIGTGGNAGAQSATTVVRAMAVGDVQRGDVPSVVLREVCTGAVLGSSLAAVALVPTAVFAGGRIAVVVCLSLIAICVLATLVGSLTPIVARRFGVDPAVVSAPLISTLVDATGLILYFLVARAVLGLT